jgi:hypothetical protein
MTAQNLEQFKADFLRSYDTLTQSVLDSLNVEDLKAKLDFAKSVGYTLHTDTIIELYLIEPNEKIAWHMLDTFYDVFEVNPAKMKDKFRENWMHDDYLRIITVPRYNTFLKEVPPEKVHEFLPDYEGLGVSNSLRFSSLLVPRENPRRKHYSL